MPFFYTMWHMLASCVAAFILQCTCAKPKDGSLPSFGQLWEYKWELVPIAILTFVNNGFNNASLGAVALYVNQVIKATGPLPTSGFEYLFMGKVYTLAIYITVGVIVGGCILSQADSFASGGSSQLTGVLQCLISLFAATLRPVLQKLSMSGGAALNPCGGSCGTCLKPSAKAEGRPALTPSQVLFWDAGLAFWFFVVIWLADSNERENSINYLSGNTDNPNSGLLGVGIILFGSFLAFIFNIAVYYYIIYTSALASTIGSNGVKIFLIVIAALTEGGQVPLTWVGIAIVVVAIGAYAYLSYQFSNPPKKADEKTPLTSAETKA
jgi:drug/metabolite transporter (DMT)-like permease